MSFNSEYLELRKKRKEREQEQLKAISAKKQKVNTQTEKKLDFSQKGVFDDGYQAGDISKAILGTVGDAGLSLVRGLSNLGEGLVDTVGYAAAGVAELLGKDGWADDIRRHTQDSYTDDMFYIPNEAIEDKSVLGRTSQAILEGVGQAAGIVATAGVGGAAGLGTKGVTALTSAVTGLSSFGSGTSEAYQSGATDKEAVTYGMISAASDVLTEMLFGGLGKGAKAIGISKGLSSADDMLAKKVSSMFSNQITKNLSEFGIKAGAEGIEEVLAGVTQAVGKKLTYMSEKDLKEILKDENLLEQFIVGMASSGFMQAGDVHNANKTKTDFITGFSQNEQSVVDKVYKDKIAEATKDGKKLSSKDKSNIYDSVLNDLEKGYISIDTIESVLGGETYKQYQSAVEQDNAMQELEKEYNTLYRMKNGEKSDEQIDRQKALKQQLEEYKSTSELTEIKDRLSNEVSELAKSGKLVESYNEKSRRSQTFEADLTQYDAKHQGTYKRAIESGILNNTNRSHEFVDLLAKLEEDKGVLFDFTNNEKIKDSGFAVEGKQVNGYVQGNNIAINIDSTSALNKVVGHEITHILEGTELYTELQSVVKEYATMKGEYDTKLQSLAEAYEGIEDANIENELTADLIGEYLFTDSDFINSLSAEKPTLFKKIFDEIKYLCKAVTSGSKEARQLEKVKKTFEDAYKQKNNTATDDGVKYSIKKFDDGKQYVKADRQVFSGNNPKIWGEQVTAYINDTIRNGKDVVVYAQDGDALTITENTAGKAAFRNDIRLQDGTSRPMTDEEYAVKLRAESHIDELSQVSRRGNKTVPDYKNHNFAKDGFNYRTAYFMDADGKYYRLTLSVGKNGVINTVYNVGKIKEEGKYSLRGSKPVTDNSVTMRSSSSNSSVPQENTTVNNNFMQDRGKYSLSNANEDLGPVRSDNVYGKDIKLDPASAEDIGPIGENVVKKTTETNIPDNLIPLTAEDIKKQNTLVIDDAPIAQSAETTNSSTHKDLVNQMSDIMDETSESEIKKNDNSLEAKLHNIDIRFENAKSDLLKKLEGIITEKNYFENNKKDYISSKAEDLYLETKRLKKGTRATKDLAYFLDLKPDWNELKSTLLKVSKWPDEVVNPESEIETVVREQIEKIYNEELLNYDTEESNIYNKIKKVEENAAAAKQKIIAQNMLTLSEKSLKVENTVSQEFIDQSNKSFGIEKPNDYIHVQRQVFSTLKNEGFFTSEDKSSRIDYNEDSGMVIETNKSGIKETFSFKNYSNLGKTKKAIKLATIRKLPEIIRNGKLVDNDVDNYHNENSSAQFAYIQSVVEVDGKDIQVQIDIKKSPQKNKFWVHRVHVLEKANELPAVASGAIKQAIDSSAYENSVPNSTEDVKGDLSDYFVDSDKKQTTKSKRKTLHENIISGFKDYFNEQGLDLDETLKNGKRLSTLKNNDNTPQRVMEKTFGYKAGGLLADLTVNKIAQNETEGIKWLNIITGKKGLLRKLSKEYNIKPRSNESAAAQMYLEGFYVNESDEYVRYGDAELAADFPDRNVRENIRQLAMDPRVRVFYDLSLNAINEARVRNAYEPIARRDNYALHFRAMDDTFSRLGVPFNPNDITAKDLPTDLNGVTADLKPGQPYFASAKHRIGVKTTYDLLGGMERYATSAKNQIYHIDDIQSLRALRNYIADMFGQAKGLEGLDELTADEAKERIEQVYNGHLSNFAMWLNEEANVIAGKTALMDRAVEGFIGRRGLQFLNKLNGQVGSNQVGFNISSSLTNIIPVVQTFAKSNKFDFAKAFAQTVTNKVQSINGNDDGFAEKSPVMIRRKGAESFAKTPYQKAADVGYVFMSAVDGVATELIARTKFNEYTRKGMDEQKAHIETDKWVSKLMGDRSLGQQPLLYNSKTLGLFTKYQLEVRNQLDSMFYDTLQEAKEKYENIEVNLEKNAKTAAKVTSTVFQLAVAQHIFGTAFESVAGYNPAFGIIEVILTACGYDDDEDSDDDFLDNLEQAFLELLGDLPYSNLITGGGRIPIQSALPIKELVNGEDQYGYEKSRWETLGEALPYYIAPTGYGQYKKTKQGLSMFDDDLPIAGSYTDSDKLRFTIERDMDEMIKAGFFGQYSSSTARQYFDEERAPLSDKKTQELIDLDIPIEEYWEYQDGLRALGDDATLAEKVDYIADLEEFDTWQKNIMANNLTDRKEPIDLTDYDKYGDFEELDFAIRYPEKYAVLQENGISVSDYKENYEKKTIIYTDDFSWASNNPEKYVLSKAVTGDVIKYKKITSDLSNIEADKDSSGDSISGSRKNKVVDYINSLDIDFGSKIILYRSQYESDDTYNHEIIDYLNSRDDISREDMETILKELEFEVYADGTVRW